MAEYARVAVEGAPPEIDKLYDYALDPSLWGQVRPGMRVIVPFGRGNRRHEAMVIALADHAAVETPKSVETVIDGQPVLDAQLLKLALHLRARLGCAFYTIVHAMLPAGLWYRRETKYCCAPSYKEKLSGCSEAEQQLLDYLSENPGSTSAALVHMVPGQTLDRLLRRGLVEKQESFLPAAREKTRMVYQLTPQGQAYDPAAVSAARSPARHAAIEFLKQSGQADAREIEYYTGASRTVLSGLVRSGLAERSERRVWRQPDAGVYQPAPIELNEQQSAAVQGLCSLADLRSANTALLFGVTGSGKTEVYIQLIRHVLEQGGRAILLVPEISLTPQLTARFSYEFGARTAVVHSALALGERYDEWSRIQNGDVDVVIGTRSAVFAPLQDLRLIIIDEEHEQAFASDTDPRYHARDVALYRARENAALLVLGSATPSIDTAYRAKTGEYAFFSLPRRARDARLAEVTVCDRRAAWRAGYKGDIGPELARRLGETLARGEQAVFFLNRRGSCRSMRCLSCGYVPMCVNCSSALSYHRASGRLMCHLCGYSEPVPACCPSCGGIHMEHIGSGTQSVEHALAEAVPGVRVLRMDSDTTQGKDSHEKLLARFAAGEADVLVGTQMIAKGLDFPNVTLSAVIDADMSLYTGDFRASERTFSLITQVIGRSGRAEKPGYAIIQTASPDNEVIRAAARQDYWAFYASEILLRQQLQQPPFTRFSRMSFCSPLDSDARSGAARMYAMLRAYLDHAFSDLDLTLLGPAQAPVHKVNNQFYYTIYLKYQDSRRQRQLLSGVLLQFRQDRQNRNVKVYYDLNL